jgi:hypothetical protein
MYTQLTSFDNLLLAYHKAAKGKRGHPNVAAFEYHLEDNLLQVQRELQEHTYQPGEYHSGCVSFQLKPRRCNVLRVA